MSCEQVQIIISAHLDGEAAPDEWRLAQSHMAECSACRRILANFQAAEPWFRNLPAEDLPAEDQWTKLSRRLNTDRRSSFRSVWRGILDKPRAWFTIPGPVFWPTVGFALLVLIFFLVWPAERTGDAERPLIPSRETAERSGSDRRHPRGFLRPPAQTALASRLGDHFERSEMMLLEVANYDPEAEGQSWTQLREMARELLVEVVVLRRDVESLNGPTLQEMLEEMETLYLEIANLEDTPGPVEISLLKETVDQQKLAFKIWLFDSKLIELMGYHGS